jgi:tubulin alpha
MALVAAVTGANRGIGLEICRQLSLHPEFGTIYGICRQSSPELNGLADMQKLQVIDGIQIMEPELKRNLKIMLGRSPIDVLIHNAGAYGPPERDIKPRHMYTTQTFDNVTAQRMLYSFHLNAVAPLLVTKALIANLRCSRNIGKKKIIIIGSIMGSISDNDSGGHYGYRVAKTAVNQVAKNLSIDLKADGIAVGVIHPGYVFTAFHGDKAPRQKGQFDVRESVRGVLQGMEQVTMDNTGCFLHGNYGQGVKQLQW